MTSWKINVTFSNSYGTALTIGNWTAFYTPGNNTTNINVVVYNSSLPSNITQTPIRLLVTNLSNITVLTTGVPLDTILTTDISGSMDDLCGWYLPGATCQYDGRKLSNCSYQGRNNIDLNLTNCSYQGRNGTALTNCSYQGGSNITFCSYRVRLTTSSPYFRINCSYKGNNCDPTDNADDDVCNTGFPTNRINDNSLILYSLPANTPICSYQIDPPLNGANWHIINCSYSGSGCTASNDVCNYGVPVQENWTDVTVNIPDTWYNVTCLNNVSSCVDPNDACNSGHTYLKNWTLVNYINYTTPWTNVVCNYNGTQCIGNDACNSSYNYLQNWSHYNYTHYYPWNNVVCNYNGTQCIGNDACNSSYIYLQNWSFYNYTTPWTTIICPWVFGDYTLCSYANNSCNSNYQVYHPYSYIFTGTCNESSRMINIAIEADKLFVSTVLNQSSAHRIGLNAYSINANRFLNLTNNSLALYTEINTYSAGSSTCTCCAINRAVTMLSNSTNKTRAIVLLSDGMPSVYCDTNLPNFNDYTGVGNGINSDPIDIQTANDSANHACSLNISLYTIGFGSSMGEEGQRLMKDLACNDSMYYDATNISQLQDIYTNISNDILIAANYSSQTITVSGTYIPSFLYEDSYIDINYTPDVNSTYAGMISLSAESGNLGGCNSTVNIPSKIVVQDAIHTSFSGPFWTKYLNVNSQNVFNLTSYGTNYTLLGDPFQIQVPSSALHSGINNLTLSIGDTPTNSSNCSTNNTFIYTALINSTTKRVPPLEFANGCNWTIQTIYNENFTLNIPSNYSGPKHCNYTNASISYNASDAYDTAMYLLLSQLDPTPEGRIIVNLLTADLEITITTVSDIPYMWGPALAKIEVTS
jgi:hypothetical protein